MCLDKRSATDSFDSRAFSQEASRLDAGSRVQARGAGLNQSNHDMSSQIMRQHRIRVKLEEHLASVGELRRLEVLITKYDIDALTELVTLLQKHGL